MSTYDGAYSNRAPSYYPPEPKKTYQVLQAIYLDVYHYHGSCFEYKWKLGLKDEAGNIKEVIADTYRSYSPFQLVGSLIEYDGENFTKI